MHLRIDLHYSLHELLRFTYDFAHVLISLFECCYQLTIELLILHDTCVPAPTDLALKGLFLSLELRASILAKILRVGLDKAL